MKRLNVIIVIILISFVGSSCKKNGTNGDATIVAFPQHHSKPIFGGTVYVKFNAKDLPSNPTKNYDLKIVGDPKEEHVHIKGLLWGDYYLYAEGYDTLIHLPVKGGLAIQIKWGDRQKELDLNVPVTE